MFLKTPSRLCGPCLTEVRVADGLCHQLCQPACKGFSRQLIAWKPSVDSCHRCMLRHARTGSQQAPVKGPMATSPCCCVVCTTQAPDDENGQDRCWTFAGPRRPQQQRSAVGLTKPPMPLLHTDTYPTSCSDGTRQCSPEFRGRRSNPSWPRLAAGPAQAGPHPTGDGSNGPELPLCCYGAEAR